MSCLFPAPPWFMALPSADKNKNSTAYWYLTLLWLVASMEVKERKNKEKKESSLSSTSGSWRTTGFRQGRNRTQFSYLPSAQNWRSCEEDYWQKDENSQPEAVLLGTRWILERDIWGITVIWVNNDPVPGLLLLMLGKRRVAQQLLQEWD